MEERKTHNIHFKIEPSKAERLRELCKEEGYDSLSSMFRDFVLDYIKKYEREHGINA